MAKIDQKLTQLADIVSGFAPVIKELKSAYDAVQQQDDIALSDGELEEDPEQSETVNNTANTAVTSEPNEVDDLVQEVTENEPTAAGISDKMASVLESILASGLNEAALNKRKEKIHRPANCNLLWITKVNSEIWDVAQKSTRSMDARLQKLQEALVKGLTPIARLAGLVGDSLGKTAESTVAIPPDDL